ncbi:T9SS type A sorting domain-containing protein [uncultured Fibrobacter sp.]|nr:T9SS type A sorting domain-containing protein [uncultured Fibrobacter sp.]
MIDSLGYLAVKYRLEDPTTTGQTEEYPYNFVKFGFNIVQMGDPGLDISSIGGLCATYTSDMEVWLEVITDKTGNTPCFAKLPKAVEPTTVDKAIEDFAQPTWAADSNKVASCMEAFKAARSVMFKIDGGASVADGELRIFEVGPKGTCKGGKTVKDYWPGSGCKSDGDGHAQCPPCGGPGCFTKLSGLKTVSSASISVLGRLVTLNGLGQNVQYKLFDMQGNVVRSGYAAGNIDFGGVKSGSYLLKVKGNLELTEKIVLK